jgi:hypothetical protein
VQLALLVRKVRKARKVHKVIRVFKVRLELRGLRVRKEFRVSKERLALLVLELPLVVLLDKCLARLTLQTTTHNG